MKVLAVVSTDYGELGNALYFVDGLELDTRPLVMLPQRMQALEPAPAGLDIRHYSTLKDIVAALDESGADTVLLFSGYLMTIGQRLSLLNTLRLLRELKRRKITVLTSDPFIGEVHTPFSLDFAAVVAVLRPKQGLIQRVLTRVIGRVLALRIYCLHYQLRKVWNIYPAPMKAARFAPNRRWLSYYNARPGAWHEPAPTPTLPSWIFVLSRIDCEILLARYGEDFATHLCERVRDARRAGRRAVVIATKELVATLRDRLPAGDTEIELRAEGGYLPYMSSLMAAEYAFFWNYFSFSILHRVIARRPVFFFATGHMVKILPSLAAVGIENFYGGWTPPLLALTAPLNADTLTPLAQETRAHFGDLSAHLRESPSPSEVLRTACNRAVS